MRGAVRLVRFAGIPVYLHWTFGLLILWVGWAAVSSGLPLSWILMSVGLVCAVFVCVVLHEYGHALTARQYDVRTRDIILSPIGGIARLERIPEKPRQEMIIAIAGPTVNILIAGALLVIMAIFTAQNVNVFSRGFWDFSNPQPVLAILTKLNLIIFAFNLIPAFPMDGGRVLRAVLAIRYNRPRATIYASYVGRAFALVFVGLAVYFGDIVLGVIGVFIFFSAGRENQYARMLTRLEGQTAGDVCKANFRSVSMDTPVDEIMRGHEDHAQEDFLILGKNGDVYGVLQDEALEEDWSPGRRAGAFADQNIGTFQSETPMTDVLKAFQRHEHRLVLVMEGDEICGLIDQGLLLSLMRGDGR